MLTDADKRNCEDVLLRLCSDADQCSLPENERIVTLCRRLLKVIKERQKAEAKTRDDTILRATTLGGDRIRSAASLSDHNRLKSAAYLSDRRIDSEEFRTSTVLSRLRSCYICKERYEQVHHFYDRLCTKCGDFNFEKRAHSANLNNMIAVVTGARLKIGFQTALKLLRAGATVVATTRFPQDALNRYGAEDDFCSWSQRLCIYGLDLRSLPAIDEFVEWLNLHFGRQNILINNAAMTIQRPPAFYANLMAAEKLLISAGEKRNSSTGTLPSMIMPNRLIQLNEQPLSVDDLVGSEFFPIASLDEHDQQVDLRESNSWVQKFSDVSPMNMLQTHLINAFAPFYLLQKSVPLLSKSSPSFVVNVSAVEGIFQTHTKTSSHVHTNMAKASMNMITRTLAETLAEMGIYINSVDTGWITNEFPIERAAQMREQGFYPPLDEIDGASRVCHPIFSGISSNDMSDMMQGKLLKNYMAVQW